MTNELKTPAAQPACDYPQLHGDPALGLVQYTAMDVRAAIDADRAMRAQAAPAAVAIPDGHLYAALNDLLTHIGMEGVVTADHPFVLDTMAALKRIDGGVYLDNLAIPTEPDAYRADMLATVILLEDGEWTEHHAKTPLGMRLEDAITKLHNELHAASASGGAAPAAVAVTSDEDEALDLLAHLFDAWENGPQCYEDPDEQSGYIGQAFRLDNTVFHRCADLLNRRRPHQEKSITAPQPPVVAQEPVAWMVYLPSAETQHVYDSQDDIGYVDDLTNNDDAEVTPLYPHPAPQQAAQGEFDADDMQQQWDTAFQAGKLASAPIGYTDGGRNMFYEGRFEGESAREQKVRLAWADNMRAAFERYTANSWFDKDWHRETALWAAAWRACQQEAQGDALTYEQAYAIRQGHEIASSDAYFNARPQIDGLDRRNVFRAGFERGWDAARAQAKEGGK